MTTDTERPLWRWNPRLRVSRQMQGGETVYVLQDPATEDNFQVGELEYEVARCFDATKTVPEVCAVLADAGHEFDPGELEEFVEQMVEAGLLVPAADATQAAVAVDRPQRPRRQAWRPSRFLFLQVAAFNAESFFRGTLGFVRPLLGTPALVLGVTTVMAASFILVGNWSELGAALAARVSATTLLAVWFWYGFVVLVHEMPVGGSLADDFLRRPAEQLLGLLRPAHDTRFPVPFHQAQR